MEARSGREVRIARTAGVGGGCVSPVARLTVQDGDAEERWFLKWREPAQSPKLLPAEARGLRLLGDTGTVRVPEIGALGPGGEWLLLEWIEPGTASPAGWARLGSDLAALHRSGGEAFGAVEDNFIGPLPQANDRASSWWEFWALRRLEPQLRLATDSGWLDDGDRRRLDTLMASLEDLLAVAEQEGPSPLHGDLWNGNVHMAAAGRPAVVDPSAYHGHREVDLAMAELFGGFGVAFRDAYEESWPLQPGFPRRRAVYQLYYLLVHVNLFGGGYVSGCRRALQEAGV